MSPLPPPRDDGLRFGLLGSLRIEVGGDEVRLDSPTQRRLLAALLVDAGATVSTDRLAEAVWGGGQPEDPDAAIHTHVSRLRRLLERWGGDAARAVLATRPGGYALEIDRSRIDIGQFEHLIAEARAAPSPHVAAGVAREALELWRGAPLHELDHERADSEAARLRELRGAAVELRADALLRLGRHDEVVAELELPVSEDPLRERLRGQLMVALYRCGRQADALAAYQDLRDRLVTELGLEPSAELRDLERAILQQVEDLPWPAPADARSTSTAVGVLSRASTPVSNLPVELTSFVGRERDVASIAAALGERRVLVLTGVGGVGKSRLARRVARTAASSYADGVVVCDLVGADDPGAVADVVATVLGVLPASGHGPHDALVEMLRGRELLLVLDNCEHVLAGASELSTLLVTRCPGVDVLATSRRPLDISGQQVWPVAPLEVDDEGGGAAVELFGDRARATDPSVDLSDEDTVVEICRRLDGLPLAIELAASQVRSMNPADIADRLDRRFELLATDSAATSSRHRRLEAVLEWSYERLPDPTRHLSDRLAVFAGGFGPADAELVCGGDGVPTGEVAGRLAELVAHSLVAVDRSGRHARYRMLESLRAFGERHLAERDELDAWRRRHAEHFASLAEEAAVRLQGPDEARWVRVVDTELANLRAAHHWACSVGHLDVALRLPAALRAYAYQRLHDEAYSWALRALGLPGASTHPAYAAALVAGAVGRMQRGELDEAHDMCAAVVAAAAEEEIAQAALQTLTEIALYQGRLAEVDQRGAELADRARSSGNAHLEALGHLYRVHAAAYRRSPAEAHTHLRSGWRAAGEAGTPTLRAAYHYLDGEIRLDTEPEVARVSLERAIVTADEVRNRFVAGIARVAVASLEARHGEPADALAAFRGIIEHWRACGDWVHMWTTLRNLLVLFERVGAHDAAALLVGAVDTPASGARPFGEDAERLQAAASSLRRVLGAPAFAAAEARGRCMTDEEVVEFSLRAIEDARAAPSGEDRADPPPS